MARSRPTWLVFSIGALALTVVYLVALAGQSRFEIFVLPLGEVPDRLFFVHIALGLIVGLATGSGISQAEGFRHRRVIPTILGLSFVTFLVVLALRRLVGLGDEFRWTADLARAARLGELLAGAVIQPVAIVLGWYWRVTVRRSLPAALLAGIASFAVLAGASELMEGELPVRPWQFVVAMILVALGFLWRIELVLRRRRAGPGSDEGLVFITRVVLALVAISAASGWFAAHLQELVYQRILLPRWPDIVKSESGFSPVRARDGGDEPGWERLSSDHEVLEVLDRKPRSFFKASSLLPRSRGLFQGRYLEFGLGDRHLRQRSPGGDLWLNIDSGRVQRWWPTDDGSGVMSEELARSDDRPFSSRAEIQSVDIAGDSLVHDPAVDEVWYLGSDRSYHRLILPEGERIVSWGWRIDDRLRYEPFDDEDVKDSVHIFLRGRIDNYLFSRDRGLEVDRFGRPARNEAAVVEHDILAPVVEIRDLDGRTIFRHRYGIDDLGEHLRAAPIVVATLLRAPLLNMVAFLAGEDDRPERIHKALVIDPLLVNGSRAWLLSLSLGFDLLGVFVLRRRLRAWRIPPDRSRFWLPAALLAGPVLVLFALMAERGERHRSSVPGAD